MQEPETVAVPTDYGEDVYPLGEGWLLQLWKVDRWLTVTLHRDLDKIMERLSSKQAMHPDQVYRVVKETIRYTIEVPPTGAVLGSTEAE